MFSFPNIFGWNRSWKIMPIKRASSSRSPARRVEKKPRRIAPEEDLSELERGRFELDRGVVIYELTALRQTIANGARQMEAIAMERMFEQPLSEAILHESKAMRQLARRLKILAVKIASSTGYPEADEH